MQIHLPTGIHVIHTGCTFYCLFFQPISLFTVSKDIFTPNKKKNENEINKYNKQKETDRMIKKTCKDRKA
jgi:hypothetical protein